MRARVKTACRARRRWRFAVQLAHKRKLAADFAALGVVFQRDFHALARVNIHAPAHAVFVFLAEPSAPVVITHAQLRPFRIRYAKGKIRVITFARVGDSVVRQIFRFGNGEVAVCRQVAKARLPLAADRPAPETARRIVFLIIGEDIRAEQIAAKSITAEQTGVAADAAAFRSKCAQLPAKGVIVVFNNLADGVKTRLRLAPAQRALQIHARAAHQIKMRRRRIAQSVGCQSFGIAQYLRGRIINFRRQSRAAEFAPFAEC